MAVGLVLRGFHLPSRAPCSVGGPALRYSVRWVRGRPRAVTPKSRAQDVMKSANSSAEHRLWVSERM